MGPFWWNTGPHLQPKLPPTSVWSVRTWENWACAEVRSIHSLHRMLAHWHSRSVKHTDVINNSLCVTSIRCSVCEEAAPTRFIGRCLFFSPDDEGAETAHFTVVKLAAHFENKSTKTTALLLHYCTLELL